MEILSDDERQIADALQLIRRGSERLADSRVPLFVNFAIRTLAALKACETQFPAIAPPSHLTHLE